MVYQKEAGRLEDNKLPLAVGSSNVMSKLDCWGAMEQKTGLRNQVVFLPCNFTIEGVRKIVLSNAESECTIRPRHCLVDHSQNPASWRDCSGTAHRSNPNSRSGASLVTAYSSSVGGKQSQVGSSVTGLRRGTRFDAGPPPKRSLLAQRSGIGSSATKNRRRAWAWYQFVGVEPCAADSSSGSRPLRNDGQSKRNKPNARSPTSRHSHRLCS